MLQVQPICSLNNCANAIIMTEGGQCHSHVKPLYSGLNQQNFDDLKFMFMLEVRTEAKLFISPLSQSRVMNGRSIRYQEMPWPSLT